ncbi:hypothetical protein JTE90_015500 [Oedothorax gibbosus]|uniref:Uncharacterized protein n=1 Tax=Oedothorax gibbosus TaxID=931172 RepID=A0AAV6VRI3_9ARAC|nr:hypothetical protein JTE90_015500 [Oedothorax gibbosus]
MLELRDEYSIVNRELQPKKNSFSPNGQSYLNIINRRGDIYLPRECCGVSRSGSKLEKRGLGKGVKNPNKFGYDWRGLSIKAPNASHKRQRPLVEGQMKLSPGERPAKWKARNKIRVRETKDCRSLKIAGVHGHVLLCCLMGEDEKDKNLLVHVPIELLDHSIWLIMAHISYGYLVVLLVSDSCAVTVWFME